MGSRETKGVCLLLVKDRREGASTSLEATGEYANNEYVEMLDG